MICVYGLIPQPNTRKPEDIPIPGRNSKSNLTIVESILDAVLRIAGK